MFRQRFKVEGSFDFPIDMLRYDECYPLNETDSAKIIASLNGAHRHKGIMLERIVHDEDRGPNAERWESFDWRVVPGSLVVEEILEEKPVLDWTRAAAKLQEVNESLQEIAKQSRVNVMFYAGIVAEIKGRYEKGERTKALFDAIMELD